MQKLDATMQEVTYYRNIVTFDAEINQTFPHRSDSETGKILEVRIMKSQQSELGWPRDFPCISKHKEQLLILTKHTNLAIDVGTIAVWGLSTISWQQ